MAGDQLYDVEVDVENDSGETVIRVRGEVDHHARETFRRAVQEARCLSRRLVFDMSGTTFIDGCGLGILLEASRQHGRDHVIVSAPTAGVLRLLDVTGILGLVCVEERMRAGQRGGTFDDAPATVRSGRSDTSEVL